MRNVRMLCALLGAILLALPIAAQAQTTSSVKGTAVIRQRVALPNNAVVSFQLIDASRAGAAATVLAEQRFTANGQQAPFQFELKYDPARIQANGIYTVQGSISVDGRTRYTTTSQYRVISGGNPTTITITLDAVSPLPNTASGASLLSIALVLLALAFVIRRLRPRFSLPPSGM